MQIVIINRVLPLIHTLKATSQELVISSYFWILCKKNRKTPMEYTF
jgi:hypothetical protein